MANLGKAWAVLRSRITGNKEKAAETLNSMHPIKLAMMNRLQAQSRGPRRKSPYKLGERPRRK